MEDKKLISAHIFIFPFRWDYIKKGESLKRPINERLDMEKFDQLLPKNYWEEDIFKITKDDMYKEYNEYIYFYDNVRQAIYQQEEPDNIVEHKIFNRKLAQHILKIKRINKEEDIVKCYKFKNVDCNSRYIIEMKKEENGNTVIEEKYELELTDIKLKVYNTGVATLTYFTENYNDETTKEDILRINEYGRRIYPQFSPIPKCINTFLAQRLVVSISNNIDKSENFDWNIREHSNRISGTITGLLGVNFSTDDNTYKDYIKIRPVVDDRMFVVSAYRNNFLCKKLKSGKGLGKDFWYEYTFIDTGSPTCQDDDMLEDILRKATYTRWRNYGTLYGVSRYSFVMLKDEGEKEKPYEKDVFVTHMQTMYYQMVALVLVQRASILRFSDELSKVSKSEKDKYFENISNLQKLYIKFINSIYFREVTAQEQGIELYSMLMDKMQIERDVQRLDQEIGEVNNYANQVLSENSNNIINLLTYFTIGLAVCDTCRGIVTDLRGGKPTPWQAEIFVAPLPLFIAVIAIYIMKKKNINKVSFLSGVIAILIILAFAVKHFIL